MLSARPWVTDRGSDMNLWYIELQVRESRICPSIRHEQKCRLVNPLYCSSVSSDVSFLGQRSEVSPYTRVRRRSAQEIHIASRQLLHRVDVKSRWLHAWRYILCYVFGRLTIAAAPEDHFFYIELLTVRAGA